MARARRKVVAVVGGGITGLAAAWELRAAAAPGADLEVVVFEQSQRPGGRIETVSVDGKPLDTGPDAFITRHPAALELCRELGLEGELIAPSAGEALILTARGLRPLPRRLVLGVPTDLLALARSSAVSPRAVARVAADLVLPRPATQRAAAGDPTVAEMLGPRLGSEALALLVDPLIGGINAGAAAGLSFRSVMPQVAAACAGRRSVVSALRQQRRSAPPAGGPIFNGLTGGLGQLVDELVRQLGGAGVELRLGSPVSGLRRQRGRLSFSAGGSTEHADGLVVALPAPAAAELLDELSPQVAAELAAIECASVALATCTWDDTTAAGLSASVSGVLVPRPVRDLVTACTVTSAKWPRSADRRQLLIRASVGSSDDERHLGLEDDELCQRIGIELARILGIAAEPASVLLRRFDRAFPQYAPGHAARVARIRHRLDQEHGVTMAGAALDGIGIPACIASGRQAARVAAETCAGGALFEVGG